MRLQRLLDSSRRSGGKHLLDILRPATASEFCKSFVGVKQVAWATVTSRSEPRVAPVDAVFVHGRFYLSTDRSAVRTHNVRKNPATSLTYLEGIAFATIVHGTGRVLEKRNAEFNRARRLFVRHYGKRMMESVDRGLVFIRVDPKRMYTHKS
jgi:uncharacterized pyridoxamine 5'-phosphate oxidase family protein